MSARISKTKSKTPSRSKTSTNNPKRAVHGTVDTESLPISGHPTEAVVNSTTIRLFQFYQGRAPLGERDPDLEPITLTEKQDNFLEATLFIGLNREPSLQKVGLWGAFSEAFTERTGLSGAALRAEIEANPGFDVYFCNPYPETEALYHNLWIQGEVAHPNFIHLSREFLKAGGLSETLVDALYPSRLFASCNYFVATPPFWNAYLAFVESVVRRADETLSEPLRAQLASKEADARGLHHGSSYLRFILERLFSIFLMVEGATWRGYKIPLPAAEKRMNVHLRLLREMRDLAIVQKSYWQAACWANYRTLYLTQIHDRAWLQRYLASITPTQLRFGLPTVEIAYPLQHSDQRL